MQNLGFTFALVPLIKSIGMNSRQASQLLSRHLQLFNTHPYLTGPVLGSIVKLEEEAHDGQQVMTLKKTLMGPYAAMGDTFFWGAWRPLSAIGAVVLAMEGVLWAPLIFLIFYNPLHFYVRLKGFVEGYRRGIRGIDFIGGLNLPGLASQVRWITVLLLGILAMLLFRNTGNAYPIFPGPLLAPLFLGTILLFYLMITRGISMMKILYGAAALSFLLSY